MKVALCSVELDLEINLTDALEVEKWEEKADALYNSVVEIEKQSDKKFSQTIREEVEYTSKWLDEVFGEGTGEKVLENRVDLSDVYGILHTVKNLHRTYIRQVAEEALSKYSPDRAMRK